MRPVALPVLDALAGFPGPLRRGKGGRGAAGGVAGGGGFLVLCFCPLPRLYGRSLYIGVGGGGFNAPRPFKYNLKNI